MSATSGPPTVSNAAAPTWTFLTNHAQVLVCIAEDPEVRLRDIGERVGITERAAHRIVNDLAEGQYIKRERHGRRNQYLINAELVIHDPFAREPNIGQLLEILGISTYSRRDRRSTDTPTPSGP